MNQKDIVVKNEHQIRSESVRRGLQKRKDDEALFRDMEDARLEWLEDEILGDIDKQIKELKTRRKCLVEVIRRAR